jgi:hypothetical protein
VALLAAEADLLGDERDDSLAAAAFHAKYLSTELALRLLFELLAALRTHLGRLLATLSHQLS